MQAEQRIKFAIEFAGMNLAKVGMRPQELAALKDGISQFLYGARGEVESFADRGGIIIMPVLNQDELVDSWPLENFIELQKDCRRMLTGFAHKLGIASLPISAGFGFLALPNTGWHIPTITAGIRSAFLMLCWLLLVGESGVRVRICPEDACGHRVFYQASRRQKYCSRNCAVRASMRRMRNKSVVKSVVEFSRKPTKKHGKARKV